MLKPENNQFINLTTKVYQSNCFQELDSISQQEFIRYVYNLGLAAVCFFNFTNFSDVMEQEISIQPGNDGGLWLYPTVILLKAFIFSKISF